MRRVLYDIGEANPQFFDIFNCGIWMPEKNQVQKKTEHRYISLEELVATYAVLIDIEGRGYSGRLKCLLWSRRPLIIVDRPHTEYFVKNLKEWIHYVPVKRDLSDLIEKTRWCLDNYEKAANIADQAYIFSQTYLTRDACYSQWDKIITEL